MPETIIETKAVMERLFAALHVYVEREKASMEGCVRYLEKNDTCRRSIIEMPEGQRWRGFACSQFIAIAECMATLEHSESDIIEGKPVLILREPEGGDAA